MRSAIVCLLLAGSTAHADPAADVTKAMAAFIEAPASAGVELFVTPFRDDDAPVPADLAPTAKLVDKPKLKAAKVVVAKGGKSAWFAGEVNARVPRQGKLKTEALRVSALLALDAGTWRVRATAWSATFPNTPAEMCGNLDAIWRLPSSVPKELAAPVKSVLDAFDAMPPTEGMPAPMGGDRAPLQKLLSDDPNALVIGSAAKEKFSGGAAIKALFKKWFVTDGNTEGEIKGPPARAATPDGELMWMYFATQSHAMCQQYRTFAVLAKEAAGWRIVHLHFSESL